MQLNLISSTPECKESSQVSLKHANITMYHITTQSNID